MSFWGVALLERRWRKRATAVATVLINFSQALFIWQPETQFRLKQWLHHFFLFGLLNFAVLFSTCHIITYLLIYSMVQSPSWAANCFAVSQEIPRISRNPNVHYRTHKRPPPVSILGQPNPVYIPTSHLLQIRPNIIHPSTPRSPQWSPSLRFPHQEPILPPLLTHTCHMPGPLHIITLKINYASPEFKLGLSSD